VLRGHVLAVAVIAFAGCGEGSDDHAGSSLSATAAAETPTAPKCRRPAEPTPAETEGPYYKPGPPQRRSLLGPGVSGRRLQLRGRVRSTSCRALPGARVDFWQANGNGVYDNTGFRLRGYQRTDAEGRYRLDTVLPGRYENRTRHIHVKVRPRGGEALTTQLYFPGEAANRDDFIFDPKTLVRIRRGARTWRAAFDFVVAGG
jgi:protocatechuate 3,4-dioxygenase beta subunit